MSDEYNKAIGQVATRNAQAAVSTANQTRHDLTARLDTLERLVVTLNGQIAQLQNKYNLLLTARFNGGSTEG